MERITGTTSVQRLKHESRQKKEKFWQTKSKEKNKGDEDKLFAELANKFSAVNALDICGDSIGKGGLDIINESGEDKENAPSAVSKENVIVVSKKVTKDKSGGGKKANIKKVRRPLGNSRLVNA